MPNYGNYKELTLNSLKNAKGTMDDPDFNLISKIKSIVGTGAEKARELISRGKEEVERKIVSARSGCELIEALDDKLGLEVAEAIKDGDFDKAFLSFEARKKIREAGRGLSCSVPA